MRDCALNKVVETTTPATFDIPMIGGSLAYEDLPAIRSSDGDVRLEARSTSSHLSAELCFGPLRCNRFVVTTKELKGTHRMISYVTVGADDIAGAKRFYSSFLLALGYELEERPDGLIYALRRRPGQQSFLPEFYVKAPFDGGPASAGNGAMIAFKAQSQKQVRDLHAAALAAGGLDDGKPGFRDMYGPRFYVGYLRDPQGNKSALFSNDPNEPGRDG